MLYAKSSSCVHTLHCVFTIAWLYIFPTILKLPLGVYQRDIYSLCLLQLLEFSLQYHMVAGHKNCQDDEHISKYPPGIPTYYNEDGMPRYIRFILLLLHDGALMLTYFHCKYSLYTMLKFPQVLCIQNVYTWYIFGKHLSTTCIQYVYIAFSFFSAAYTTIILLYFFKHHIFLLSQSLADACLWVARLRGGLVHSRL